MILTRALEHGWRQRADLHASLMVPSTLLLALLDAVKAGRDVAERLEPPQVCTHRWGGSLDMRCAECKDALAAWRKVVGE